MERRGAIKRGDPELLAECRKEIAPEVVDSLFRRVAYCWDVYGLPDGTLNPTHGSRHGHMTMTPDERRIIQATDHLIAPLLSEEDKWVLSIPRGLLPGHGMDAELLTNSSGSAALVLPWAGFGSLFYFNELCLILDLIKHGTLKNDRTISRPVDFWEKVAVHWFTGTPPSKEVSKEVQGIEILLDLWRHGSGAAYNRHIWATTVFQQCVLLLHEFGHLIDVDRGDGAALSNLRRDLPIFTSFVDELAADAWCFAHGEQLAKQIFVNHPTEAPKDAAQSVVVLFGLLNLIRESEGENPYADEYAARCMLAMKQLAPVNCGHVDEAIVLRMFNGLGNLFGRKH